MLVTAEQKSNATASETVEIWSDLKISSKERRNSQGRSPTKSRMN